MVDVEDEGKKSEISKDVDDEEEEGFTDDDDFEGLSVEAPFGSSTEVF